MKYIIPLFKVSREAFGINPALWGPKLREYFYNVEKGIITTRSEAASVLYNTTCKSSTFKSIEESAREKLIDQILTHKTQKCNDYQKKIILIRKVHAVIHILLILGLKKIAVDLSEWIIKLAKNYHLTDVELSLADILERYYLSCGIDNIKVKDYKAQSDRALFSLQVEREAYRSYRTFYTQFNKKKAIDPSSIDEINEICENLKEYFGVVNSFKYLTHYYILLTFKYELDRNYSMLLKTADDAFEYFNNLHFEHTLCKIIFLNIKASALIALRDYSEAENLTAYCNDLFDIRDFNWCRNRQYALISKLNLGKVEEALFCYKEVVSDDKYEFHNRELHDSFELYSVYLRLFQGQLLKIQLSERFRIYINDPNGVGISVRIAELWDAGLHEPQRIGDLVEATQKYIQRHLNHQHLRSRFMLELILSIPIIMYDQRRFKKRTELLYAEMVAIEPYFCPEANEIEIITYELLWHQILKTVLPNKYNGIKQWYEAIYDLALIKH